MAAVSKSLPRVVEYDYPVGQPDITRPVILRYNGMSFRKCSTSYRGYVPSHQPHTEVYNEEDNTPDCMDQVDDLLECTELPNGDYKLELQTVPSVFYKYIIGKQGRVKQTIERDTKSQITIPRQGSKGGAVVIQAKAKRSLNSAKQRIEVIVWSNRKREDPTHFMGIALHSGSVQDGVTEFSSRVLKTSHGTNDRIDASILQRPIKMHLTLVVLRLFSDDEIQHAISTLREIIDKCKSVIKSRPLSVGLKGINCMNDDHSSVDVVYSEVQSKDNELQQFADMLLNEMISNMSDYVTEDRRSTVKLHATVMNSSWRQGTARRDRQSFDATNVFKNFKDYDFGSCEVSNVMLLNIKEKDEDGFYKRTHTFDLNN